MGYEPYTEATPLDFLLELEEETSSWRGLPHCPDTVTMRNMIRLGDWIANHPTQWSVIRDRALFPHMR